MIKNVKSQLFKQYDCTLKISVCETIQYQHLIKWKSLGEGISTDLQKLLKHGLYQKRKNLQTRGKIGMPEIHTSTLEKKKKE